MIFKLESIVSHKRRLRPGRRMVQFGDNPKPVPYYNPPKAWRKLIFKGSK